jgi:hypothetical protein
VENDTTNAEKQCKKHIFPIALRKYDVGMRTVIKRTARRRPLPQGAAKSSATRHTQEHERHLREEMNRTRISRKQKEHKKSFM